MKTKTCFKCGRTLPITEFYTHPQMLDGHLNKCKECTKRDVAERKKNSPESDFETRLKTCRKNPTHKNAYYVVAAAVRAGKIVKPSVCSGCGCPDTEQRMEAHHHDYSKPLDVIWLCPSCHARMDEQRRIREGKKTYHRSKRVVKILDGAVVGTYESISEAAKSIGRAANTLSSCLKRGSKRCAGFEWAYEEDYTPSEQEALRGLDS